VSVVDARSDAGTTPVRRVIRGADGRVADHAFSMVTDLPTIATSRPVTTGDSRVDALRTSAWEEGRAAGWADGRAEGYADGHESGRQDGRLVGQAEGLAAGRAQASEEVVDRIGSTLAALEAAAIELEHRHAVALADIETSVVDLALGLAAAIIEREVTTVGGVTLDSVRRALQLAPERGDLVVRVHPADRDQVAEAAPLAPGREVELVADPSIVRGGCLIEDDATRVDARVDSALERARAALLDADETGPGAR
jgi:flagellar assembly protein FliH